MIAHVRVLFCTFLIFPQNFIPFQGVCVTKCKNFFGFHRQKYRAFPAPHSLADTVVPKAPTQRLFGCVSSMDTAIRRRLASFYGHSPCFLAFSVYPAAVLPCVVGSGTPCLPCRPACRRCRSAYGMQAHRLPCVVLSIKGGKTSFQFSF